MSEPDRWGPLPTRTDRPRAAALRVLRALVGSDGITVAALSERLGGHPNSIRLQLERLVAAGFAETAVPPSDRRGRPSHAYT
ncbi:MAG: MarR family transcriptional regulator, partial [Propionicimonas sp.]|nr:MarR family transcriptional regulator [Propionicimonas sp.]